MLLNKKYRPVFKMFISGLLWITQTALSQSNTIDIASEKQLIRGFGGMNHTGFPGDITSAQADKAFGTGAGQIGLSILRIHVDPNSGLFSRELATAKKAKSYGAIIFASPWSPPTNLKTNNNIVGGSLKTESYAAYAAHLKAFCDYMSKNEVPLYAISIQNEPDYKVTYESCDWTSAQMISFLNNYRSAIGTTRIIAPESFQFRRPFSDAILNDAAAVKNVDIIGGHIYGAGLSDYPLARQKNKEVWMTEHYTTSDRSANLWPDALEVGKEIHDCMVANFNAYVWWYIRRSYGPIDDNSSVTKRGYVMSQFAKFVRPGFIRVDAPASPVSNLSVSAFKSDTSMVVVLVNKSTSAVTQKFSIKNGTVANFSKFTTSGSKNVSDDGAIKVEDGSFSVSVDAQSITTLTGKLASVGINSAYKNIRQNNLNERFIQNDRCLRSDAVVFDLRGNVLKESNTNGADQGRTLRRNGLYIVKLNNPGEKNHVRMVLVK
ncbi:MAG TPA: glucuronoxylanase [Chitinispirillaceae bacterium]|nr:glucuronoxylanase [Chitinispirillaceae bacterium]